MPEAAGDEDKFLSEVRNFLPENLTSQQSSDCSFLSFIPFDSMYLLTSFVNSILVN